MDFAGQLDTNGPEIEIANTVGLYNTLSRVKSVRLVLVVDFNSIGTVKGQVRSSIFMGGTNTIFINSTVFHQLS